VDQRGQRKVRERLDLLAGSPVVLHEHGLAELVEPIGLELLAERPGDGVGPAVFCQVLLRRLACGQADRGRLPRLSRLDVGGEGPLAPAALRLAAQGEPAGQEDRVAGLAAFPGLPGSRLHAVDGQRCAGRVQVEEIGEQRRIRAFVTEVALRARRGGAGRRRAFGRLQLEERATPRSPDAQMRIQRGNESLEVGGIKSQLAGQGEFQDDLVVRRDVGDQFDARGRARHRDDHHGLRCAEDQFCAVGAGCVAAVEPSLAAVAAELARTERAAVEELDLPEALIAAAEERLLLARLTDACQRAVHGAQ